MSSWNDFRLAAPTLAHDVQRRFEAHGLALLATLRRDGSPRISGIEVEFVGGELWLGMMPDSLKAADLRRDPRLALHAATTDKNVSEGDAKLSGRAVLAQEGPAWQEYLALLGEKGAPTDGSVFRVDVTDVSLLRVAGDHLIIDLWREGEPLRRIERR
jgi:hypothetical protein